MIYIIDNGKHYSSHAIHFVEAPDDFGLWFDDVLLSWLKLNDLSGGSMQILASALEVTWREKDATESYGDFLESYEIEQFDYGREPAEPRPQYRGT
jgi:hypothetical protein